MDSNRSNRRDAPGPGKQEPSSGRSKAKNPWTERSAKQAPAPQPAEQEQPLTVPADEFPRKHVHQDALRVISRLSRQGHEAYLVGGCVRDLLLGRTPKDFDIATAAHPRHIRRLFRNARIIGRRFKLAHIFYGDHILETSTFRAAPRPEDNGEGDDLLITDDNAFGTAAEDARRRDFTINGLFFDPIENVIHDYVGGLADVEAGLLRTIGDPTVRMAEDPVRILRAIKFATRIGFRIDDSTWKAMCENSGELERAAPPRVLEEIMRLCVSGTALGAFRMMRASGALAVLMPEIDAYIGKRDDPDPVAHDRADNYWRLLEALDADVHAGREPSRALCLAVMYLRVVERELDPETRTLPGEPNDVFDVVSDVLEPLVQDSRLPRRTFITTRRMIVDQERFKKRPGSDPRSLVFTTTDGFDDALDLYRLRSAAWGQGWAMYEAWAAARAETAKASPDALAALRKKGRRRRSRRPRRRKRGGGASE
ncbi:MAG: polynucleotide adenylyltransferase PcnB [Planctomycetota bacterium]|nr:polynucleotide adenylyltransferase PcnB [Planctomycetota bacterium]